MINYPKIKGKYHVENLGRNGVFLIAENEKHVLEGDDMINVLPYVDGKHSVQDIVLKLRHKQEDQRTVNALNILIANGHVTESVAGVPPSSEIFWSELGRNLYQAKQLVDSINLHVRYIGNVDPKPFEYALKSYGFKINPHKGANMVLAIVDDYQINLLENLNYECLKSGVPWMLVKPSGLSPLIGPIFVPGKTACWKCLETRINHNREVETYITKKSKKKAPLPVTKARIPLSEQAVVSTAVLQLIKYMSLGRNEELESKIIAYNTFSLQNQAHFVTKRPQCKVCGNSELSKIAGKPIVFNEKIGNSHTGNGIRLESPEITYNRYAHHISPLTGIVNAVYPSLFNGVGPIRVYSAGHNFALKNDELFFLKDGLRTSSSGKGRSDSQARTSALCEALERYAGVYRDDETRIMSSYKELGSQAIHPYVLMNYSQKQYEQREEWLQKGERFQVVPLPFDEDAVINWTPVWSHTNQCVKYAPTSYLFYGFKDSDEHFFCWGDSNGNAAGSSIEDATLQGFLELVERDAVCLWWYNRLTKKAVDLESLNDIFINQLISFYKEHGREFWVLDITSDTGIPSYVAINRRTDHTQEDIIMGFGAHLDARIAINRAITEMNQFIPAVLQKDEQGNSIIAFADHAALNWWQTATLENQPYLKPQDGPGIHAKDLQRCDVPNIKKQLEMCFDVAHSLGLEVLIMDQTLPDVGLPVVKVLAPGMRHFWARLAPGRLYDVPVKMGWLEEPKTEEDMNPISMFL